MVEEYSTMLVLALQHHNTTHDEYSFECNPVTGAVVCAVAGPVAEPDPTHPRPSTLIDSEPRSDPPVDAHIEPEDRGASKALTDVPCGLSDAPTSLKEATRRPDWDLWKAACLEEMNGLIDSGTIELATPPADATTVPSLMLFRLKRDENGEPSRRKGRFCARGDLYSAGPDIPIFAPTAPWVTVRMLLSIACANNYVVKTFDVKAAFTSVDRTGLPDIWLTAPFALGYPPGQASHLLKNLYGFQHSPPSLLRRLQ